MWYWRTGIHEQKVFICGFIQKRMCAIYKVLYETWLSLLIVLYVDLNCYLMVTFKLWIQKALGSNKWHVSTHWSYYWTNPVGQLRLVLYNMQFCMIFLSFVNKLKIFICCLSFLCKLSIYLPIHHHTYTYVVQRCSRYWLCFSAGRLRFLTDMNDYYHNLNKGKDVWWVVWSPTCLETGHQMFSLFSRGLCLTIFSVLHKITQVYNHDTKNNFIVAKCINLNSSYISKQCPWKKITSELT